MQCQGASISGNPPVPHLTNPSDMGVPARYLKYSAGDRVGEEPMTSGRKSDFSPYLLFALPI